MNKNPLSYLMSRRFLPLFFTQFCGAFNDNLFRQSILILITFHLAQGLTMSAGVLNNLAVGLFVLPFFIFSALAGQLADKFEKRTQIIWIKVWEIFLMLLGAIGFYYDHLMLLIIVLTGLGLQSTFFGPIKYSIIPDLVKEEELLGANAAVEAGSFIAILMGTLIGGFVMASGEGRTTISILTIFIAVIGTLSGALVPKTGAAAPTLKLRRNIFASIGAQMRHIWNDKVLRHAVLGISWIWLYGSFYITQIPVITKDHLAGDETVVTLFMACFTLGIAIGSFLCSKLLKGVVSAKLLKPPFLLMVALSIALYVLIPTKQSTPDMGFSAFLAQPLNCLIAFLLIISSACIGLVAVPLYAILQKHAPRPERSRVVAATNIFNSGFMTFGAILTAVLLNIGLTTPDALLIVGLGNLLLLPSAAYLIRKF